MNKRFLVSFVFAFGLFFVFLLNFRQPCAFAEGTVYDANELYASGALTVSGGSITSVSDDSYNNHNYLLFTPTSVTEENKKDHYIEFKINIPVSSNYDIKGVFHSCGNGGYYTMSINGNDVDNVSLYSSPDEYMVKNFTNSSGIRLSKGINTFRIYLSDITLGTVCGFDDITLTNKTASQLAAPDGLSWEEGVAQWNAVSNAAGYRLQLLKDNAAVGSPVTATSSVRSYDFTSEIEQNGYGYYTYIVTAIGDGYSFEDSVSVTGTDRYDYYTFPVKLTSDTRLPDAVVNSPYSFTFSASGGYSTKSYSYSSLPNGLEISNSGILSCNLSSPGIYNFTVNVTDGRTTDSKVYQLQVDRPVALVNAAADGNTDTATSHYIDLTFDQSISGLTKDNITLTDGTGAAVKGELSGSGTSWKLNLGSVTLQGNITLNITSPAGYVVSGFPVTVAVYKYKPSSNASLSDLKIGGNTISGFTAGQYAYNLVLPYGTKPGDVVAKICATPADTKATVTVTQAEHFPGDAVVTVTAEDTQTVYNYTVHLSTVADTIPVRKAGVTDHAIANVIVNQPYTLKLSDFFEDANSMDTLTYQVSVNGAAYIPAAEHYSYIPGTSGQTTLKFIANDGTMDSTDTYTVTLNAAKPKYMLTISAGNGGSIVTGVDGNYEAGAVVSISANAQANYNFAGWISTDGGSFGNSNSCTTTFVMPAHPVTVKALFSAYQPVVLVKAVADGNTDQATSTYIELTFDHSITGLTKNDITLTDGTGAATKGELSGSGTLWRLSLESVTLQGNLAMNITSPIGYMVSGSPATVEVYKYKPSNNAFLSNLKIGGNTVSGFTANQYEYSLELPYGTKPGDAAAKVSAVSADAKSTVTVTQADHFPGDAVVTVISEDTQKVNKYTIHISAAADTAPVRKSGVADHAAADILVNQAYTLKLSDLFEDANSIDTLNYKVSINGAAYIPAKETYSYTPTASGVIILKFIANDKIMDSTDTYTVTLNVSKPKYKLTITAGNGGSIVTGEDGNYEAGAVVTISADAQANYSFTGWTSTGGGSFGDINNRTTTFVMPAQATTVMAMFTNNMPSGNGSSSQSFDNTLPTIKGNSIKGWNEIKEYITKCTTGSITVDMNGNTGVPIDILKDIRGKDIRLTIHLSDELEWIINGKNIPDSWQKETTETPDEQTNTGSDKKQPDDLNLQIALDTHHISDDLIRGLTSDEELVRQLSLTYEGNFGFPAVLCINLNQNNKGKTAYLYYFNPDTNKLELQSIGQIDDAGNTEIIFHHASDYVILIDDGRTLKKLEEQISEEPSRKTLYIRGTKDNTTEFSIKYPQEITKLIADGNCTETITYSSSDPEIAYVDSKGKVTVRKKGKVTITSTININGITRKLQTMITVKKARIKLIKYTDTMNKGETYRFKANGYGVDASAITWSSTKKSIIVINQKTGKALAKTAGTDYISAKVGDITTNIKVVVK